MERSGQPAQAMGFSTLAGWLSLGLLLFTHEEARKLLACRNRHRQCWQSWVSQQAWSLARAWQR